MKKILIIDDDEGMRSAAVAGLNASGYATMDAASGIKGLEIAKSSPPDLILCDISMPGMDGYEFLASLRMIPTLSRVPLIFITGKGMKEDLRKGMQSGADDYLPKPFTIDDLVEAIESRLKKEENWQQYLESRLEEVRSSIGLSLPHEIRTPLTAILGFSDVLIADNNLTRNEVVTLSQKIHKAAARLNHMLENFILYTQLETICSDQKRIETLRQKSTPSLKFVLHDTAIDTATKHKRSADLHFDVQDAELRISESYFRKIIEELVDNACKFSKMGTPIVIRNAIEQSLVRITVQDKGTGMTEEELHHLGAYTQFERHAHEQQGAGLGLTIAAKLVELHGGAISVTSEPSEGTSVLFSLPAGA